MMGHRERLIGGAEYDVFYDRRWYCYTRRPGVCKKIKVKFNRRIRRNVKRELNEYYEI